MQTDAYTEADKSLSEYPTLGEFETISNDMTGLCANFLTTIYPLEARPALLQIYENYLDGYFQYGLDLRDEDEREKDFEDYESCLEDCEFDFDSMPDITEHEQEPVYLTTNPWEKLGIKLEEF